MEIEVGGEGSFEVELLSGNELDGKYQFGSEIKLNAIPDERWKFRVGQVLLAVLNKK
ncbi:MAG: hypothetical protein U5K71_17010 [Gracilimonas sp.]|nr:hypothetical protein [Gracilimonas sp.]